MRSSRWWIVLAAAAAVVAVLLLVLPTGGAETCETVGSGPTVCTRTSTFLLASNGGWVLVPLFLPAAACLLPLASRSRGTGYAVACALTLFCVLGAFTIGLFFLPVAVGALVVAARSGPEGSPRPTTAAGL